MKDEKLVYILILNYNSSKETIDCVNSILDNVKYKNFKLLILDNKSTDKSNEILSQYCIGVSKEKNKEIQFILNGTNYGYAHGNNKGIKIALQDDAEFVCIVNPDVIVKEDFLSKLVYQLNQDKNIGMICPAGVS